MMYFSIQRGDRGQTVSDIQKALNQTRNANLVEDGIYGANTDKAVRKVADEIHATTCSAGPGVFRAIGIEQVAIADISDHQFEVDFRKLRSSGVQGVILKASEGFDWQTRKIERFAQAKDAGLLVGAYHFGRPDLHDEDPDGPKRERENYEDVLDRSGIEMDFLSIYDFEKGNKEKDEFSVWYCQEWNPCIIYTAKWAIDSLAGKEREGLVRNGEKLWIADYVRTSGKRQPTDKISPWGSWQLWQHTNRHETDAVLDRAGRPARIDMNWTHRGRLSSLLRKEVREC
jgi:hypothetical protein